MLEENKRLKKEGRTLSVQFEEAGEEGRLEEDGAMEVHDVVDSKKKFDR